MCFVSSPNLLNVAKHNLHLKMKLFNSWSFSRNKFASKRLRILYRLFGVVRFQVLTKRHFKTDCEVSGTFNETWLTIFLRLHLVLFFSSFPLFSFFIRGLDCLSMHHFGRSAFFAQHFQPPVFSSCMQFVHTFNENKYLTQTSKRLRIF